MSDIGNMKRPTGFDAPSFIDEQGKEWVTKTEASKRATVNNVHHALDRNASTAGRAAAAGRLLGLKADPGQESGTVGRTVNTVGAVADSIKSKGIRRTVTGVAKEGINQKLGGDTGAGDTHGARILTSYGGAERAKKRAQEAAKHAGTLRKSGTLDHLTGRAGNGRGLRNVIGRTAGVPHQGGPKTAAQNVAGRLGSAIGGEHGATTASGIAGKATGVAAGNKLDAPFRPSTAATQGVRAGGAKTLGANPLSVRKPGIAGIGTAAGAAGAAGARPGARSSLAGTMAGRLPGGGFPGGSLVGMPSRGASASPAAEGGSAADKAKNFGKDAAKEVAKGALTGGWAGAGKGLIVAVLRNKWAMGAIIAGLVPVLLAPMLLISVIGSETTSATTGTQAYNTQQGEASAEADGVTAADVTAAETAVQSSTIPWQIWLAYTQNGGAKGLGAPAVRNLISTMQTAMDNADGNNSHWDLLNGTVYAATANANYRLSTASFDVTQQTRTQSLWVGLLQNPGGLPQATASAAFASARTWALGVITSCPAPTSATGGAAPTATGVPVATAPVDGNPGTTLSTLAPSQVNNARAIIGITKTMFASATVADQKRAALIGIITPLVESHIENLTGGDLDSVGAYQQRNSWGTFTERTNIYSSASLFFNRLIARTDWATTEPGTEAQNIQGSAFPTRYAVQEPLGTSIIAAYWDNVQPIAEPSPPGAPGIMSNGHGAILGLGEGVANGNGGSSSGAPSSSTPTNVTGCNNSTATFTGGAVGTGDPGPGLPGPGATMTMPQADPTKVSAALAFAALQIGKPYVLGGAGPNDWDCSGLTMKAYEAAGIQIGVQNGVPQHNARLQMQLAPKSEIFPYADRERGDLLFWSGAEGIGYHTAIYLGRDKSGQDWQLAATKPGTGVMIQHVWGNQPGGDLDAIVVRPSVAGR